MKKKNSGAATPRSKTYGQQFEEALALKTPEEGAAWLRSEVKRLAAYPECKGKSPAELEGVIRSNVGYMTGYYGAKEAAHVRKVLNATHPFFGDLSERQPTADQALNVGKAIGQAMRKPRAATPAPTTPPRRP